MFDRIRDACRDAGIEFKYRPRTRLRSIWLDPANGNAINYTLAAAENPDRVSGRGTTDYAFLAMPPGSLSIVADGSRYDEGDIVDVLNADPVALYREAVILEPAYKIGMFFDCEWWKDSMYPPRLSGDASNHDPATGQPLPNVFGPTVTDTPLRQVYYFGDNSPGARTPVYGILASYDDERFSKFWRELELGPDQSREVPHSRNLQPLDGAAQAPDVMVRMLRSQLAQLHWGPAADLSLVPEPLETVFMDWSLKPFSAGYHTWAPHFEMDHVMSMIRKPTQLASRPGVRPV